MNETPPLPGEIGRVFHHATAEDWDYIERLLVVSVRHQQDEQTKFWLAAIKALRAALTRQPAPEAAHPDPDIQFNRDHAKAMARQEGWCRGYEAGKSQAAPGPLPQSMHWLGDRLEATKTMHSMDARGCVLYFDRQSDCLEFMRRVTSITRPTDSNKFGSPSIDNLPGEN